MMLFLACLDLTFALVLTLNIFPLALPNYSRHVNNALPYHHPSHKQRWHSAEQCNNEFATCFALLSKDGGFLGQLLYGRGEEYSSRTKQGNAINQKLPHTITLYCRSLNDGLACVDSALRGCQALIDKDIIKKVRLFMRSFRQIDLCTKPSYQEAFIDHQACFLGLRTQPLQVGCVHHLVAHMNAAQQKALSTSQDASLNFLFTEYCRAFQAFLDCIVDDLTRKCGVRGRDLVLHTLYQVMGFEGRKRTCDVQIRPNDIFSSQEDNTRLISFVP